MTHLSNDVSRLTYFCCVHSVYLFWLQMADVSKWISGYKFHSVCNPTFKAVGLVRWFPTAAVASARLGQIRAFMFPVSAVTFVPNALIYLVLLFPSDLFRKNRFMRAIFSMQIGLKLYFSSIEGVTFIISSVMFIRKLYISSKYIIRSLPVIIIKWH